MTKAIGGLVLMCKMAAFLRNCELTAKALSVARGRKAVVCDARTPWASIHSLTVGRFVFVGHRMNGWFSTAPRRTMRVWWPHYVCDVLNDTVDHTCV